MDTPFLSRVWSLGGWPHSTEWVYTQDYLGCTNDYKTKGPEVSREVSVDLGRVGRQGTYDQNSLYEILKELVKYFKTQGLEMELNW